VKKKTAMKILIAVLLVLLGTVLAKTLNREPHDFVEDQCRRCHYDLDNDPRRLKASVSILCSGCHREVMQGATHPFDIIPKTATVPPDLPLTDGRVTCNTCHNVHTSPTIVFGINSHFLRRGVSDVKDFCVACHRDNFERPGHKELFIVAHEANKYQVTQPEEPIDPLSTECIGCHDGSIGPETDFTVGSGVWMHLRNEHPIGVNYMEARMRGGDLRPEYELDERLRLFDGRVGCGTCHDWFKKKNVRLVMAMDRGALCLECHYNK
jgi:predicted CXXCH cytochrome family protein